MNSLRRRLMSRSCVSGRRARLQEVPTRDGTERVNVGFHETPKEDEMDLIDCPTCHGSGFVPSTEWNAIAASRPGYRREKRTCPECHGAGMLPSVAADA